MAVNGAEEKSDVFGAISHPARRRMLDLLADADHSVNAIAEHFDMSRPAVSQHFRVPGNPKLNFDGLTVRCEVLECDPPSRLAFSWSAGGPVENTRVTFRLEPDTAAGGGTRLLFEHAGFDLADPFGQQAFKGAEF